MTESPQPQPQQAQPQQQPPPPQPQQQPPPPQPHQAYVPAQEPRNGFGITALVLAIVGLVFGLIPLTGFIAVILGALALLFGLLGYGRARRGVATNKKMSVIGAAFGAGVVALGIWGMTIVFGAFEDIGDELEQLEQDLSLVEYQLEGPGTALE